MVEDANLRLSDVLERTARSLVGAAEADACAISRVLGDVLIIVAQVTAAGPPLSFGQGFLVSDYPQTQAVLATGEPRALTVADEGVDEAEAELLRTLGFGSLLMLPYDRDGSRWGLVELYRLEPRPFDADATAAAAALL